MELKILNLWEEPWRSKRITDEARDKYFLSRKVRRSFDLSVRRGLGLITSNKGGN